MYISESHITSFRLFSHPSGIHAIVSPTADHLCMLLWCDIAQVTRQLLSYSHVITIAGNIYNIYFPSVQASSCEVLSERFTLVHGFRGSLHVTPVLVAIINHCWQRHALQREFKTPKEASCGVVVWWFGQSNWNFLHKTTQFIFYAQSLHITQSRFNKVDVAGPDDSWASWFVIIGHMPV